MASKTQPVEQPQPFLRTIYLDHLYHFPGPINESPALITGFKLETFIVLVWDHDKIPRLVTKPFTKVFKRRFQ